MTQKNKDICFNNCSALLREWYNKSIELFGSEIKAQYVPHIYAIKLFSALNKRLAPGTDIKFVVWTNLHAFLIVDNTILDLYTNHGIDVVGRETIDKYFGYIATMLPEYNAYLEVKSNSELFGYELFKANKSRKQTKCEEYTYTFDEIMSVINKLKSYFVTMPTKIPLYMFEKDFRLRTNFEDLSDPKYKFNKLKPEAKKDHYFLHM